MPSRIDDPLPTSSHSYYPHLPSLVSYSRCRVESYQESHPSPVDFLPQTTVACHSCIQSHETTILSNHAQTMTPSSNHFHISSSDPHPLQPPFASFHNSYDHLE